MKKIVRRRTRRIVIGIIASVLVTLSLFQVNINAVEEIDELIEIKRYTYTDGYANHIVKASDGGFFVAAKYGENLTIVRLNQNGEEIDMYLNNGYRYNEALIATSDGGCIVVMRKSESTFTGSYIRKFKADLTLEYERKITNMQVFSIVENTDGYLLAGRTGAMDTEKATAIQIGKTENENDILWTKHYGVEGVDTFIYSIKKIENGYVATIGLKNIGKKNLYFLDNDGNEISKTDIEFSGGAKIDVLPNGKIILMGLSSDDKATLMEVDEQGNTIWRNDSYNYKQDFQAIKEVDDGYIVIGERTYNQYVIAKVNKNDGSLVWSKDLKRIEGEHQFKPYDFELINENEFIVTVLSGNNPAIIHYKYQLKPSEVPTYVVSFDTVGGNTIAPQTIQENKLLSDPGIPTKIGYKFEGWFMSNGENWNIDSNRVTEALLLTAKWSPITPTFNEIPSQIYVGDTFTLNPSIDGLIGETGWTYDKSMLSAAFNSPATFTALKVGKTTIMFSAINGQTVSMEINVLALDKKSASTKPNSVGTNDNVDIYPLSFLLLGSALLISCRLLKKSE